MTLAGIAPGRTPLRARLLAAAPPFGLCVLTLLVLAVRRPDQYIHPYVFVEDGRILQSYAQHGLSAVFGLIHGFLNLSSRIISITSFKLSVLNAPAIGVALTTAFTCFVVLCVYFSSTHLRARFLCAAVPLVIPTGPENFAIPLTTYWWAGLLLLPALLWRERHQAWRIGFILVGGLSCAVIIPLSGLFVIRALFERRTSEWVAAAVAAACALLSIITGILYAVSAPPPIPNASWLLLGIGKFLGGFTSSSFLFESRPIWLMAWGVATLLIMFALFYASRAKLDRYFALLVAAFVLVALAPVLRAPLEGMHPYRAGPRYFFYQFIIIGWILIWIAAVSTSWARAVAASILAFGIAQGFRDPAFQWRHEHWDWKAHIIACANSTDYELPIHYMGGAANPYNGDVKWHMHLTGAECRRMIENSLFGRP